MWSANVLLKSAMLHALQFKLCESIFCVKVQCVFMFLNPKLQCISILLSHSSSLSTQNMAKKGKKNKVRKTDEKVHSAQVKPMPTTVSLSNVPEGDAAESGDKPPAQLSMNVKGLQFMRRTGSLNSACSMTRSTSNSVVPAHASSTNGDASSKPQVGASEASANNTQPSDSSLPKGVVETVPPTTNASLKRCSTSVASRWAYKRYVEECRRGDNIWSATSGGQISKRVSQKQGANSALIGRRSYNGFNPHLEVALNDKRDRARSIKEELENRQEAETLRLLREARVRR